MNWINTFGIIASYLFVVFGVYFFDWSVTAIFWAYYLELIVLLITYVIVRTIDRRKNPAKYRKLPDAFNILFASLPLLLLQYLFLKFLTYQVSGESYESIDDMMRSNGGWFTLGVIAFVYTLRTFNIRSIKEKEFELQQNFFLEILALSGTNMLGFIAAAYIEILGTNSILILMLSGRIAIELYFRYKTKWV